MRRLEAWILAAGLSALAPPPLAAISSEATVPSPDSIQLAPAGSPWARGETREGPPGDDGPGATKYLFVTGSNLHPRNGTIFAYAGFGCIRPSSSNDFFTVDLQLPGGAEIDEFRLYYYDATAGGSVIGFLNQYDGQGGFGEIFSIVSDTDAGYGSVEGSLSYTVDTAAASLSIVATTTTVTTDLRICGVRIRYRE